MKFKVWDISQSQFIKEDDLKIFWLNSEGKLTFGFKIRHESDPGFIPVYSTGLTDKNEIEIYEGDIVSIYYGDSWSEDRQNVEIQKWGIIKGVINGMDNFALSTAKDLEYDFEIIGNVYENPELLKQ